MFILNVFIKIILMSVESNNKLWLVFYLFQSLYFSRNSYILYFTKVQVCDVLENKKQTNQSFSTGGLKCTHKLLLCLQFEEFLCCVKTRILFFLNHSLLTKPTLTSLPKAYHP